MGEWELVQYVRWVSVGLAFLLAVSAAVAALLRRRPPFWSAATVNAAIAFAALTPAYCGQLQSDPPYTACSSLAGARFGFRPERGSFWHNGHEVLTAQTVLLAYAVAAAAFVVGAAWLIRRAGSR